jgi:hypothetical protein
MNEKIQAILLRIVLELKKQEWSVASDWEITLKGEGHVPLSKTIQVSYTFDSEDLEDRIETMIDLKFESEDEVTYFPSYTIYANIFIDGGESKDIAYKLTADVAFTDKDVQNTKKTSTAASRISRLVEDHIKNEYGDYIDQYGQDIKNLRRGGIRKTFDAEM